MAQCQCGIGKPHGEDGIPYDVPMLTRELTIVTSWFSEEERKTGTCRCGQRLREMPMIDCPMDFHHSPDFIPSNPQSPYFAAWIKGEISR